MNRLEEVNSILTVQFGSLEELLDFYAGSCLNASPDIIRRKWGR